MKLSILIPTLEDRKDQYQKLYNSLVTQTGYDKSKVEIISICDNRQVSIGFKRNMLMERAKGEFVCFIDDDDTVSENYIELILETIEANPEIDCIGIAGRYYMDGILKGLFNHSVKHRHYSTVRSNKMFGFLRPPNHLNPIRRSIASRYSFEPINHGEDTNWSMRISNDRVLKREFFIMESIYNYYYVSNKLAV